MGSLTIRAVTERFADEFRIRGFVKRGRYFIRTEKDSTLLAGFMRGPPLFEFPDPDVFEVFFPIAGAYELRLQLNVARLALTHRIGLRRDIQQPELGFGQGETLNLSETDRGQIIVRSIDELNANFALLSGLIFSTSYDYWVRMLDDEFFVDEIFRVSFLENGERRSGTGIDTILTALYLAYKDDNPQKGRYLHLVGRAVESDRRRGVDETTAWFEMTRSAIQEDFGAG